MGSADPGPDAGRADGAFTATSATRPVAPLSTHRVFDRRPTLRWTLPPGNDGAHVEICRDRACMEVVVEFDADGAAGAPGVDLPYGVLYWRVSGRARGVRDARASAAWELVVRPGPGGAGVVAGADVNADGYDDVLVPGYLHQAAYLYFGSPTGVSAQPSQVLTSSEDLTYGSGAAPVGDVDGDGYDDVAVAAYLYGNNAGRVYVYRGGAAGVATDPATVMTGADQDTFSILSASPIGDIDGDGYADLVVGSPGAANSMGRADVFLGGPGGLASEPAETLVHDDGQFANFGWAIAGGDVNGDGFADVAITGGSNHADPGGVVHVYYGGPAGLPAEPQVTLLPSDGPRAGFGQVLFMGGDVNGDGYADLAVAAAAMSGITGEIFVYAGGATGISTTPLSVLHDPESDFDNFGWTLAVLRGFAGDAHSDILAGDPTRRRVYRFVAGGADSPAATLQCLTLCETGFASGVGNAGDVDGDGFDDVLVLDMAIAGASDLGRLIHGGAPTPDDARIDWLRTM